MRSRTTYVISIGALAPLQDKASAERERATVKFLRLETLALSVIRPANSLDLNSVD